MSRYYHHDHHENVLKKATDVIEVATPSSRVWDTFYEDVIKGKRHRSLSPKIRNTATVATPPPPTGANAGRTDRGFVKPKERGQRRGQRDGGGRRSQYGSPAAPQLLKGIVKQVLSGDSIIIRGKAKGGPPPERQLNFSNITAPKLARRPGGAGAKPDEGKEEPWAWESREFVRKKLIGKEVTFAVDHRVPASGREYGTVYLGKDTETGENVTEEIVREGLASVRKEGKADVAKLVELEEQAKSAGRGRWGADSEKHVRDVHWQVENPQQLLDKFGRKPVDAVVEHVRDGSTVRVFLTPSFHYITLMMSGIRCPGVKLDAEGKPDLASREPFSEEAKFFTESRLLQRDVQIILESVNNANLVGSIIHPNGNIAELLLKEGFARCIDWSMGFVTRGAEKLRAGEKFANKKKLRIWKDYTITAANNTTASLKAKDKEFIGTVTECVNADALVVRLGDGTAKKVFLAGIRPPRLSEEKGAEDKEKEKGKPMRPLYDIPFMYEAREYMRKKLIGKRVNVTVDYIQPASQTFPEKICCTVKLEGANIAEALVSKGYATVVRYRQDDDQRASEYDALLAAEARAQKAAKGLHGKEVPVHHVVDLSGDATKAKQFLPYLQRAGKITAVVEYVASGSRLSLFVPGETRLITFLLAGISCPRAGRRAGATGSGPPIEGEPFGEEALAFTKDLCHQREVEIEVESIDKAGNFIGFLWIENKNLSVALVEEGLSQVHFTAERTPYFRPLQIAEENAKARRAKIWQNYEDTKETEIKAEDDKVERKVDPKPVLVTEVTPELHVYVQFTDEGDKLEALMNDPRRELNEKPPLLGAYTPKKGDLCVAKYSGDGEWYRARVEKSLPDGEVSVVFVDYGNRENIKKRSKCAALPAIAASSLPPFAKESSLATVTLPSDEDATQNLVKEGLLLVDNRKERRLHKGTPEDSLNHVGVAVKETEEKMRAASQTKAWIPRAIRAKRVARRLLKNKGSTCRSSGNGTSDGGGTSGGTCDSASGSCGSSSGPLASLIHESNALWDEPIFAANANEDELDNFINLAKKAGWLQWVEMRRQSASSGCDCGSTEFFDYFHHAIVLDVPNGQSLAFHVQRARGMVCITPYTRSPTDRVLGLIRVRPIVIWRMRSLHGLDSYSALLRNCEHVCASVAAGCFISLQALNSFLSRNAISGRIQPVFDALGETPPCVRRRMEPMISPLIRQKFINRNDVIIVDSQGELVETLLNKVNAYFGQDGEGRLQKCAEIGCIQTDVFNYLIPVRDNPDGDAHTDSVQMEAFKLAVKTRTDSLRGVALIVDSDDTELVGKYLEVLYELVSFMIIIPEGSDDLLQFWTDFANAVNASAGRTVVVRQMNYTTALLPMEMLVGRIREFRSIWTPFTFRPRSFYTSILERLFYG